MISIEQLKEQYIDTLLAKTHYNFNVGINASAYKVSTRYNNTVSSYINGIFALTQPEMQVLSNNVKAYAMETMLSLILPLKPTVNIDNEYIIPKEFYVPKTSTETKKETTLSEFYDEIAQVMEEQGALISISDGEKVYSGAVAYQLPIPSTLAMQNIAGNSIEFRISISFALLVGGVSSQIVSIKIGDEVATTTKWEIMKNPTLRGDVLDTRANGETSNYAEATILQVSCDIPLVLGTDLFDRIMEYIDDGNPNDPFPIEIYYEIGDTQHTILSRENMIFGSARINGGGLTNLTASVSFVPYTEDDI